MSLCKLLSLIYPGAEIFWLHRARGLSVGELEANVKSGEVQQAFYS